MGLLSPVADAAAVTGGSTDNAAMAQLLTGRWPTPEKCSPVVLGPHRIPSLGLRGAGRRVRCRTGTTIPHLRRRMSDNHRLQLQDIDVEWLDGELAALNIDAARPESLTGRWHHPSVWRRKSRASCPEVGTMVLWVAVG